jgi:type I restriction enzyme S subunit
VTTLGDLTEPKVDQAGPPPQGEFVYVDISSVDNQAKRIVEPKRFAAAVAPSRARQRLRAGDVLVSMTRPNLNAVALVPPELDGAIGSTGFHVLRGRESVLPQWLYYGVQSRSFVGAMSDLVQGALYPALRPRDIRAFDLPAPPLDEQRRMVAEIEKQFSRLDEAVANVKRVKGNLRRYKAAILKAAVEGRLVLTEAELACRKGRRYETGAQLLHRILEARSSMWNGKDKYKEPTTPAAADLHQLPEGWTWCAADQVFEKITDGEHISPSTEPVGVPLLSAKDVLEAGVTFDDAKYVSAADAAKFRSRCNPERDDILIVSRGATIGRACRVNVDREFCLMGSVIQMKPHQYVDPNYLLISLKAGFFLARLTTISGSTAQQAIYIRDIRPLQLPLPPLAEQKRIVAEVDRLFSVIDAVSSVQAENLTRATRIRDCIIQSFLSGSSRILSH